MVRLKRLSLAVAFAAVSGAAVVGVGATPAFAAPLLTCTSGSGTATLSPGISNTPSTQTISGTNSFAGCSGGTTGITSGSMTSTLHTSTPGTCSSLATPPAAGTVEATGTGTITWSNGTTSTGSVKAKSKGPSLPTEQGLVFKITSGEFFAAGHTTKLKVTISFSLPSGSTCPTITTINSSDVGNANITQI